MRSETDGGWGEGGSAGGNAAERPGKDGAAEQGCVAEQGVQPSKVAHARPEAVASRFAGAFYRARPRARTENR